MEKSDVYNMRAVPLMRKINIVKDGKTKSIVEENISMNEIRNMSCEPRMLIRKDDDVYFTELPINYHGLVGGLSCLLSQVWLNTPK